MLNEETKTVTQKTYDRCRNIVISSVLTPDKSVAETIRQTYETVLEVDGVVLSKSDKSVREYSATYLLPLTWTAPWGKEITGLDVMAFIKHFNDNYEQMINDQYPVT